MQRAFWKAEVAKMQQKYGAQIPDAQVEPVVDYLTKNYGVTTNAAASASSQTPVVTAQAHANVSDAQQIAMKYGCLGCHNPSMKIVGPAYRDIAAKYKTDPQALAKIDEQIHKGGSGKWGPIIMPPFPQVTATETKVLVDWILGLK
jgi:sulfite dehydrogenase